jgi:hypothetical protein
MSFENQLQSVLAQPWFEAIWVGALFGLLGGMLFIGLTHMLRRFAKERQCSHAFAASLWSEASMLQEAMRKGRSEEPVNAPTSLNSAESLLRLSRNFPAAM